MLNKEELKKVLKKNIKNLDESKDLMRVISKDVLESLLDGEITEFLGYEKYDQEEKKTDGSRDGHTTKGVRLNFGEIGLEVPRDRKSEFESVVVKKRQRDITGLEEKIVSMYAKGMTTRDIQILRSVQ
jgi:transposase-like protein